MTATGDVDVGDRPARPATPPPSDTRARLRHDHFFVADRLAPRRRRPVDIVGLIAWTGAAALLTWAAWGHPPADTRVIEAFTAPPDWLQLLGWIAYSGSGLYALVLVVAMVANGGARRGVLRDVAVAVTTVVVPALIVSKPVADEWPDVLPEVFDLGQIPTFPAFRLAIVASVVLAQSPHLTSPYRKAGRWAVAGAAAGTVVLGFTSLTGTLGGLCVGLAAVYVARVAFGSPVGLPTLDELAAGLAGLGVETTTLAYDDPSDGVGHADAVGADGAHLDVKVFGRDAADAARAERIWQSVWYRRDRHQVGASPLTQAEHEALVALLAAEHATVPAVVAVGADERGNALLVTRRRPGRPLGELAAGELGADQMRATWVALRSLHSGRIAHGSIGPATVLVSPDGVAFHDLAEASLSPSQLALQTDVVALLATTAAIDGIGPALDTAIDALGPDAAAALPYFQDAVLPPNLRKWLDEREVEPEELRDALAARLAVEPPELADLRRVSLTDIVSVVFGVLAANALVSQFASVGFDTVADEFAEATFGWLVIAFLLRLCGYGTAVISLRAVVAQPIPAGPTALLQAAKSYIGLVVPTTVGRAAMDVRFMQRLGVPTAAALAQGPLISIVGFLVEVGLLLATASAAGDALDSEDLSAPDVGGLVALAVGLAVLAVVVVLVVPRFRNAVVPFVRTAIGSVRSVVTSPSRLLSVAAGELSDRLVSALALAAVVVAFGAYGEVSFAQLVFVNVAVGLFAGLAPVPGGIGVAEAMLAGLLAAIGLPSEQAFAIAITYRVLTSYLPPILGFFALRWLRDNAYL